MIDTTTLKGTGVALVTPMNSDTSIDFEGLTKLIDHVIKGGVDYLVSLGTTGEAPTLSWDEKLEVLNHTIRHCNNRVPVVFGLGSNNTQEANEKLKELKSLDISAILSVSPYYNRPSQEGITKHYESLADNSDFPVILYNVPRRTSSNIEVSTILTLSRHENIIGIKDATDDMGQIARISSDRPDDFLLLSGEDSLAFHTMCLGGDGLISVLANAIPNRISNMISNTQTNLKEATGIHLSLLGYYELGSAEGNPTSIKAALQALDICENHVRLPLSKSSSDLIQAFSQKLRQ